MFGIMARKFPSILFSRILRSKRGWRCTRSGFCLAERATAVSKWANGGGWSCVSAFTGGESLELWLDERLIEQNAWDHVQALGVKPQMVFCHPKVLETHPSVSLYYRGMAGLSMK